MNINMALVDISNLMDINVRSFAEVVTMVNGIGCLVGGMLTLIDLLRLLMEGMGRNMLLDGTMVGLGTILLSCVY